MAKYRVCAESIDFVYIDIEADSPEEAKEFADEYVDGGEFHNNATDVDWRYSETIKLKDDAVVDYNVKEFMKELER